MHGYLISAAHTQLVYCAYIHTVLQFDCVHDHRVYHSLHLVLVVITTALTKIVGCHSHSVDMVHDLSKESYINDLSAYTYNVCTFILSTLSDKSVSKTESKNDCPFPIPSTLPFHPTQSPV